MPSADRQHYDQGLEALIRSATEAPFSGWNFDYRKWTAYRTHVIRRVVSQASRSTADVQAALHVCVETDVLTCGHHGGSNGERHRE